jgi:hypothetical protein
MAPSPRLHLKPCKLQIFELFIVTVSSLALYSRRAGVPRVQGEGRKKRARKNEMTLSTVWVKLISLVAAGEFS